MRRVREVVLIALVMAAMVFWLVLGLRGHLWALALAMFAGWVLVGNWRDFMDDDS